MEQLNLSQQQQAFINDLKLRGKSLNTVKNYQTDINVFISYLLEKKKSAQIKGLSAQEVKEYSQYLEKKYASSNSIRRRVQALRIFFDWLIAQRLIEDNPIKKAFVSPKVVSPPAPLPFKDVKKLYEHLKSKTESGQDLERLIALRNLIVFDLIYGSGLKVSDIEKLEFSHIFPGKTYRTLVTHPKRDAYTIELPEHFGERFVQYRQELNQRQEIDQVDFDQLLFNANPYRIISGGLSARGIEILFKELSKQLKMSVSAKNLRQACVFKWLQQERPHSQIKEWMGVQPAYSLAPYTQLAQDFPDKYVYQEVE